MQKILIIEDEVDIRDSLKEILELSSFDVYSAKNGVVGFDIISRQTFDMILCDINMPQMNGFELLEKIKKDLNILPKLMFVTAKVDKDEVKKGISLGALEYIIKPFDYAYILERINFHLQPVKQKKP